MNLLSSNTATAIGTCCVPATPSSKTGYGEHRLQIEEVVRKIDCGFQTTSCSIQSLAHGGYFDFDRPFRFGEFGFDTGAGWGAAGGCPGIPGFVHGGV